MDYAWTVEEGGIEVCDLTHESPSQRSTSPVYEYLTTEPSVSGPPMTPSPITLPDAVSGTKGQTYVLSEYHWRRADDTVRKIREDGSYVHFLKNFRKKNRVRVINI